MSDIRSERILVMSHAHPDFSLGGGEIAAYNLFKAYRSSEGVEDAWFLGRVDRGRGATGIIGKRRDREYIWEQGIADWTMKAAHRDSVRTWFADLLRALRPTIVHAHHYVHLGLDFLRVIKEVDPDIKIFLTLHEYVAICANNGQMIKTNGRLCSRESLDECRLCFPERTAEDFWLRKQFFRRHFELVDGFISPSEFLRGRYVDWGIDSSRIAVIENGQTDLPALPPRRLKDGETRNRFGYFGQINPYKGLDVVLSALASMSAEERSQLVLEVHGANLELQSGEYQEKIERLRKPLMDEGVLRWAGPYQPSELRTRMSGVDWVIVPSTWWENSPMVIQEALTSGRPLLVSDIGGMAEKVSDGVVGHHVPNGNYLAWSESLLEHSRDLSEWDEMRSNIVRPVSYEACAEEHLLQFASWRPAYIENNH
ncbi:glycosyltransferase [Brachybacterium sp. J153]|uniref:glycosyltransferase n=1 Tax=Brachybacterium sp. J153 TaxID=3116488 RepID=UPI002E76BCF0|nr:glycosyltransferase [Brachybacterium sp. J153]MEE1617832.1 glycosyltransferase [Brachybacterium sp. J153]